MIRKRNNKFVVLNSTGTKVLGSHETRAEALAQLQAIEINKKKPK